MTDDVKVNKGKAVGLPTKVKPKSGGVIPSPDAFRATAAGKRFILTSAQNNTKVHKGLWKALNILAAERGAQIMVARYTYNKNGFQNANKKGEFNGGKDLWYASEIFPHVQDDQIKIAPGLLFCAELDILPTAKDPLSGLDNYTGTNSMVVPHAKVHMRSYAGLIAGQAHTRFGYTTGTCTLRNYIDRRAGQIASYHHVYGALYVEVADDGRWFARQINAEDDGSFFELDLWVHPTIGARPSSDTSVLAQYAEPYSLLNLGDIHAEKMDVNSFVVATDLVRSIKPRYVVIHDLLDFEARNHHNVKDPFFRAAMYHHGVDTVEGNFKHSATVLNQLSSCSTGSTMLIVRSNHDMAFDRWLKEFDGTRDPANARFYHYHMWRRFEAIEKGDELDSFELALEEAAADVNVDARSWVHVKEDDSYVLHGIELGLHGHLGPNGARGNPKSYRQLGRKLNTGHTHSASIIDGVWTAGVCASLRMGYNKGPSSWSHSHILTHPNGKRQMITQFGDKWRA